MTEHAQTPTLTRPSFVHLRVHTVYSLSEGAVRVKDLAKLCRDNGMPAVAMTDTNNLFGGLEFAVTLASAGIQPIIGCQLSVMPEETGERGLTNSARSMREPDTVVVLVQNAVGYQSLLSLIDALYREAQERGGACLTLDELLTHSAGIILLTGGTAGPIGRLLSGNQDEAAEATLRRLKDGFGDRLYVEIMRHGLDAEAAIEAQLLNLANRLSVPIVATNEVFFTSPDMYEAHDALLCVADGVMVAHTSRRRLTPEHAFKSASEMRDLFSDLPDAVANSVLIAQRCSFTLSTTKPMLPAFQAEVEGVSEEQALREEAKKGLEHRLETVVLPRAQNSGERERIVESYRDRLGHELDIICGMEFAGYFLIVSEFIRWAKERNIPVGPGRGSGAGSVVAWSLSITGLDPIHFGLLFERFLNPERVSMPDFDIDFCQDRRDEVIEHVQRRYGIDRVAQIITFGKLQARAVLRDVGRVLGMAYGHVDKICKLVPFNPAHPPTLEDALEAEPQLREMIETDEAVARLISIARRLEGLYRHASTHAAGVVIGDRALKDLIPVYRDPRSPMLVTGYNMKWVEAAGLVKFDFLGLKTLTVLSKAVQLIHNTRGLELDLAQLPLDDEATFAMLGRGETVGVFQLESGGMRDVLRKLKPDSLEDIIAVVALYRPGPMDNIPSYIKRKHGEEEPDYLYPSLEGILRETYGIIIYQEQVMQIAQVLSGYSLGGADLLRRAMGKKIQSEMDQQREIFVDGATRQGVAQAKAAGIFDLVAKFAGYGFNKSHAAAYAMIAYQTAYLKANFPVEFFAASMTLDLGNSDKINTYRQELTRHGIALRQPDINASHAEFMVECDDPGSGQPTAVRYGLAALKNVGQATIAAIVEEREHGGPFASIGDFVSRVYDRHLNKRQLENLVRAGAFDCLLENRRKLYEGADMLMRAAGEAAEARATGQIGLFGDVAQAQSEALRLPNVDDWLPIERLKHELDAVGFYLSAHPLDSFGIRLQRLNVSKLADVNAGRREGAVTLAGTIVAKTERTSGKGNRYAHLQLSDTSGVFEVTVFSEALTACREFLTVGNAVLVTASIQLEGEGARGVAQKIEPLEEAVGRIATSLEVYLDNGDPLREIGDILEPHKGGKSFVKLIPMIDAATEVDIELPIRFRLDPVILPQIKRLRGVRDVQEV